MGCCCLAPTGTEEYVENQHFASSSRSKVKKIPIPTSPREIKYRIEDQRSSSVQFDANQAEKFKAEGNQYYANKNFKGAISSYKKAVSCSSPSIIFYTNLALAYKADSQLTLAIQTIQEMSAHPHFYDQSISFQFQKGLLIKARCLMLQVKSYCLGNSYDIPSNEQNQQRINEAIKILQSIHNHPGKNIDKEEFILTANKLKQFLQEQIMTKSAPEKLLTYLHSKLHHCSQFAPSSSRIAEHYSSPGEVLCELAAIVESIKSQAYRQQQQFLIDPITYQTLHLPVIVPSGHTYSKQTLFQHFKNNGYNDPITHQQYHIGEAEIFANHAIRSLMQSKPKKVPQEDLHILKY